MFKPISFSLFFFVAVCLTAEWVPSHATAQAATSAKTAATLLPATRLGGGTGIGDGRDADVYPAIAYSNTTNRYLVVWMSARNAAGSTANLDVYGVFLNTAGQRLGSEFKISDSNSAARGSLPTVISNGDEYVVAWAAMAGLCQIYVQRVTDSSAKPDRIVASSTAHTHSPNLTYNAISNRYAVAYVQGDDYQPPTLFGTAANTCGNNSASTSQIGVSEFSFNGDVPVMASTTSVSDGSGGAFRPQIVFSNSLNQYVVVWEDRRNAGNQAMRFDVFAQRLDSNLAKSEPNTQLDAGYDYTNLDTSSTWTPRPAIAGGPSQFMAVWFRHQKTSGLDSWSLVGKTISASGAPNAAFAVAEMAFATSHAGQAPAGFATIKFLEFAQEYVVGLSSHLESFAGYFATALVQRVSVDGALIEVNGNRQGSIGVGRAIDYDLDDQIGIGIAVNESGSARDVTLTYAKHAPQKQSQDIDVWGVRMQFVTLARHVHLPLVRR